MKPEDRIKYAKRALDGIALGDCFGQTFFVPDETACQRIKDPLTIEEENGVIEPDKYCFHLTGRIIVDNNGLSTHLWEKYIKNIIDDTLDAWAECDKIVDPTIFEFMNSLVKEDGTDASFKAFRFNQ